MKPATTILNETAKHFTSARVNLIAGAAGLYKIKSDELWNGSYDSFSAYIEEIGVSDGMASKLMATYQYYVVDNGLSQSRLTNVDHEKLYLALKLPGSATKKLSSAKTLSRGELRQEVTDPNDECTHKEVITICAKCHKRL